MPSLRDDVTHTLQLARAAAGCAFACIVHRFPFLNDNGPSYVHRDLAIWLEGASMDHVRGTPSHPQTRGHQTLQNGILLDNCCERGDPEVHIDRFADRYNHHCYCESL